MGQSKFTNTSTKSMKYLLRLKCFLLLLTSLIMNEVGHDNTIYWNLVFNLQRIMTIRMNVL